MTFEEQFKLAADKTFAQRVGQAMVTAAGQVASEEPTAPNHVNRATYATRVLNDPETYQPAWARGVAANPAIDAASTDSDLQFTVNSMWDAFAGVIAPA